MPPRAWMNFTNERDPLEWLALSLNKTFTDHLTDGAGI
jgi:hypothetical protein